MSETTAPVALLIEDEVGIRRFLRAALEGQGFTCVEATTGSEGIAHAATRAPEIVLLDLGLPDMDGLDVMRRIREWSTVPIVVLTARGKEREKVEALDGGADDYITKPFSVLELLARVRAARRYRAESGTSAEIVESGSLRIDMARRRVSVLGNVVPLTPIEYRLLATLARYAGRVLTHEFLLREVWGPTSTEQRHYLRVYMAQLRQKLEADPSRPTVLMTEPGVGYRMAEADEAG
ncbi:MAG TPA: response regulator [Candidatus Eisenbacteria bacterium]|jgi:two-component system KDP operon response regulator KdpE|nr:response regulator [Candidatus Eisenbacteria bacterium]